MFALTLSYLCMNYAFYLIANWTFLYLVQERHFTVLEGGWLAATPPLAAGFGAGLGGQLAAVLERRRGVRRGLRLVPLVSLPAAGLLLFVAVGAANGYLAAFALALCFACVELNEGPYWAAAMHVGRADTMAATGVLNTGGNLGGVIATPIIAYLSAHQGWGLPLHSAPSLPWWVRDCGCWWIRSARRTARAPLPARAVLGGRGPHGWWHGSRSRLPATPDGGSRAGRPPRPPTPRRAPARPGPAT